MTRRGLSDLRVVAAGGSTWVTGNERLDSERQRIVLLLETVVLVYPSQTA